MSFDSDSDPPDPQNSQTLHFVLTVPVASQSQSLHVTSQSELLCHTGTAHTHTPLLLYIYIILLYILSIRVLSFYCTVVHLSSNSSFGRALGLIERHQSRPHYSLIRSPLAICEKFDRIVLYLLVVPVFSSLHFTSRHFTCVLVYCMKINTQEVQYSSLIV